MAGKNATSRLGGLWAAVAALPAWLVGPIFTKELRVSSRRRRNYVLRAVYLAGLILFVALVWMAVIQSRYGSAALRASRMAIAGKQITLTVVWFQFLVSQLVTVIMLSTSISEEVYRRTLGVLMTTPINSFQVVFGKLASKMLQLVMLLAASLPVLAVVRVLGGVPWGYLLAGLSLTLTTVLVCAAVTMFFSILFRRAFVCILFSLGTLAFLWGGVPLIVALLIETLDLDRAATIAPLLWLFVHAIPHAALSLCTELLLRPRAMGFLPGGWGFQWWIACLFSLAFAAAMLAVCVVLVRRVGLRLAGGDTGRARPAAAPVPVLRALGSTAEPVVAGAPPADAGLPTPAPLTVAPSPASPPPAPGRLRPVTGSPVFWREIRARWMRRRWLLWTLRGVAGGLLLLIYVLLGIDNDLDDNDTHSVFLCIYTMATALAAAVLSATNITSEKESRSWEILLATPLGGWQILLGKAAGSIRRCLPWWGLTLGHVLLFIPFGFIHPVLLAHMMLVLLSVTVFFTGTGLLFGVLFRRTTTAVIMNLAVGLAVWLVAPMVLLLGAEAMGSDYAARRTMERAAEMTAEVNPVVQAVILSGEVSGEYRARRGLAEYDYHWPYADDLDAFDSTAYLMCISAGYVALAALLAFLARLRLRKRIF